MFVETVPLVEIGWFVEFHEFHVSQVCLHRVVNFRHLLPDTYQTLAISCYITVTLQFILQIIK